MKTEEMHRNHNNSADCCTNLPIHTEIDILSGNNIEYKWPWLNSEYSGTPLFGTPFLVGIPLHQLMVRYCRPYAPNMLR